MSGGREAAHVAADFGEDDASTQLADAGNGGQELDRGSKGLDQSVDLRIDFADCRINGVDLLQMQTQQEAVMPGDAAAQRGLQFGWAGFDAPVGQRSQSIGVGFAGDQRFDPPTTG